MTGQEWMDQHGLKAGDVIRIVDHDGIIDMYRGLECTLNGPGKEGWPIESVEVTLSVPGHPLSGLIITGLPEHLDLSSTPITPKTPAQGYSPFPTLAEFLS